MNNYYHLIYLTDELKKRLVTGFITKVITPYKNVLELFVDVKDEPCRIIFATEPNLTCLFTDSYRPPKRSNTISFFENILEKRIVDIRLTKYDRYMIWELEADHYLVFRLFGNNANALVYQGNVCIDAFKNREKEETEVFPVDKEPVLFEVQDDASNTKNAIIKANPYFPRSLVTDIIDTHKLEELSLSALSEFVRKATGDLLQASQFRVVEGERITVWPETFVGLELDSEFKTMNEAIRYAYKKISRESRVEKEKKVIVSLLNRLKKRSNNALQNLAQAEKGLEKAETYERYGHLLMANGHKSVESSTLDVEDFYHGNKVITIPLKESLSIVENAEWYYARSKNSKTSFEEAQKAIPTIEAEVIQIDTLIEEIADIEHYPDLQKWTKEHTSILGKHGYSKVQKQEVLPFKKIEVNGYEVWIGRNAKSNDKLVQFAHKEDIWMHARGVAGSHALIRNGNNKGMPPMPLIEEVAAYTAFFSKAKGAELVPVIYTKRKYIRKPKGGAAGAVKVDKEEVILVGPKKP